ncbi:flavodoxin [Peptoniphilus olsenii]|uniref:Flavodoxin n=1 Tax=Peptoniphilus olsenii TaxID=411570 RepID=A0ABV2JAB1_9FIRM
MKGLIIYSSKTGNTKRMAEKIYEVLKDEHQMTIKDIRDAPEVEKFDFILLGAWIDRGTLETKTLKFLKTIKNKKIGLFATLGAMPDSEHGRKVIKNLEDLLIDRDSLGQYICPGLVDPKMIEKLRGITGLVVPKQIKEKMIETSLKSRVATEEELEQAANYFAKNIKQLASSKS